MIYQNALELIGHTPMLKLNRIRRGSSNLYAKLEMFNMTGSVKDRSARGMIEDAEKRGLLKKGSVIVESTSGNLGVALAMISRLKGYKLICLADPEIEEGKANFIKAHGGEVIIVDEADEKGSYQEIRAKKARELVKDIPNAINLDQYNNPANPKAHHSTTGPEIFEDLQGKINVLVGTISTGGHLCGTARYLKEKIKNLYVVGAEPEGSIVFGGKFKPYLQQGTGLSFLPQNYDTEVIDEKFKVSDKDAFQTARDLVRLEGILVGGSSGTAMYAALQKERELPDDRNIVVILPDHGDRYLNTVFSDKWLKENNLEGIK